MKVFFYALDHGWTVVTTMANKDGGVNLASAKAKVRHVFASSFEFQTFGGKSSRNFNIAQCKTCVP